MTGGAQMSGYGVYEIYCADHGDMPDAETFEQYNRIASRMVDFLAGRGVAGGSGSDYVREAVHWQIRLMRQQGSVEACFTKAPVRESFAGYTVERGSDGDKTRLFGIEVSPMMIGLLRQGGVISCWV